MMPTMLAFSFCYAHNERDSSANTMQVTNASTFQSFVARTDSVFHRHQEIPLPKDGHMD